MNVTNVNDDPVANDDEFTINEDSTGNMFNVLSNDTDADLDPLEIIAVGSPSPSGTVTISAPVTGNHINYTPGAEFSGTVNFTYTITDSNGGFSTGSVTVTVLILNDPPTANDDEFTVTTNFTANPFTVLSNDTDIEGDTLTIQSVDAPSSGSASIDGTLVRYDAPGTPAVVMFDYTVSDGALTDVGTITVNVINSIEPPVISPIGDQIGYVNRTMIDVLGTADGIPFEVTDPDNDPTDVTVSVTLTSDVDEIILGGTVGTGNGLDLDSTQSGSNAINFEIVAGASVGDTATIQIYAVDTGSNSDTEAFTVTVRDEPPVLIRRVTNVDRFVPGVSLKVTIDLDFTVDFGTPPDGVATSTPFDNPDYVRILDLVPVNDANTTWDGLLEKEPEVDDTQSLASFFSASSRAIFGPFQKPTPGGDNSILTAGDQDYWTLPEAADPGSPVAASMGTFTGLLLINDEVFFYHGLVNMEPVPRRSYDDWRTENLGGTPPNSGFLEDFNSDGILNVLEFAFGFDPTNADNSDDPGLPTMKSRITLEGIDYDRMQYQRSPTVELITQGEADGIDFLATKSVLGIALTGEDLTDFRDTVIQRVISENADGTWNIEVLAPADTTIDASAVDVGLEIDVPGD